MTDQPDAAELWAVEWERPEDADISWVRDGTHTPHPTVPMAREMMRGFLVDRRGVVVNGWLYQEARPPAFPELSADEYGARTSTEAWFELCLPEARRIATELRGRDYASMDAEALAAILPQIAEEASAINRQTFRTIEKMTGELLQLESFCRQHFGEEAGEALAAELSQGAPNETAAVGEALDRLASEAREQGPLAAALRAGAFDSLDQVEGGVAFLSRLETVLQDAGWRSEFWDQIERPTWAEDPRPALKLIAAYLDAGEEGPLASRKRALQAAEAALARCLSQLSEADGAELRRLVGLGQGYNAQRESRAFWQLLAMGLPRIPLMTLGEKLAQAGALEQASDIFYLDIAQAQRAARGEFPDSRSYAADLRAKYAEWSRLTPPPFVGAQPGALPAEFASMWSSMFGRPVEQDGGASLVKGIGASSGVVEGTARVIHSLDEIDRLQPGDVLVCRSTAPPWTPMFGIASAVVTDSGGVQSHSAIVAREFAIPCVVSTGEGTTRIADGARVRVDGEAGTVEIL